MNRRQRKQKILEILANPDFADVLAGIRQFPQTETINPLFSALCSLSDAVKWNAVFIFGVVVPDIADRDIEKARVIMRRFLWSLNDESGGIGWGAPEALGEIMAHHDRLFLEYCHMLISYMRGDGPELHADGNQLELPMLQRGLLWGIGRLCETRNSEMVSKGIDEDLVQYLDSGDSVVRGMAVWCLTLLKDSRHRTAVEKLVTDGTSLLFPEKMRLNGTTVADLAQTYLAEVAT